MVENGGQARVSLILVIQGFLCFICKALLPSLRFHSNRFRKNVGKGVSLFSIEVKLLHG